MSTMRVAFIALFIALVFVFTVTAAPTNGDVSLPTAPPYDQYADAAFTLYMRHLYDSSQRRLRLFVDSEKPSNYWNSAVAFQTLLHYANLIRPRDPRLAQEIAVVVERLVQTQTTLNESDTHLRNNYNDDMSWMIHGLTALYDHTHNTTYIDMATLLFDTIKQSDDTTCCGDMKGGVWWDLFHTSKATAAQAGVTLAALRLMETGAAAKYPRSYYIQYATDHYEFWRQHMVDNQTGQVCDNINLKGVKTWWTFTYNNGLMLGAAVHLYNATNNKLYLNDANFLANYLMNSGQNVKINGTTQNIMHNDCGDCDNDSSEFHQVSFQYLSEYYRLLHRISLDEITQKNLINNNNKKNRFSFHQQLQINTILAPVNDLYIFLQSNIDSLWFNARNTETGIFNCNWDAPFSKGVDGLQGTMNTAMSALSLFASLPKPPTINNLMQQKL